jgi:hypothetical protein
VGYQLQEHGVVAAVRRGIIRHTEKFFIPPLFGTHGISEQAGRVHGLQAGSIINGLFSSSTVKPLIGTEFQLAGRVIAGMTDHAAVVQDRFDFAEIIDVMIGCRNLDRSEYFGYTAAYQ